MQIMGSKFKVSSLNPTLVLSIPERTRDINNTLGHYSERSIDKNLLAIQPKIVQNDEHVAFRIAILHIALL